MYALYDTFNDRIISRHRSIVAVVKAAEKLSRSMTGSSYLPTKLVVIDECGDINDVDESDEQYHEHLTQKFHYSPLSEIK